jgi:hypothetical protein
MAIDLTSELTKYNGLKSHLNHELEIVGYAYGGIGPFNSPFNIAIECMDCGEVIIDANRDGE